ncbi:proprotein convertase P-domain-containing protein [Phytohabitans rumicis]|uniref:P/Homo B domain-containing protein n=1 Tax=Phytohabitans rumicis TaxID=1076125 RepID=A0A6V8LMN0_9ACTN|nr:proprotein convertase P-domain-containing protein [Phytohabitans rumicis]GFJ93905.1 hypothetical protein Prum_075470 [Phytohabitans rumicis]
MKASVALAGVTVLMSAALFGTVTGSAAAPAKDDYPPAIRAAADDDYAVYSRKVDANGASHVRYTRTYRGLRVRGADFVIHTKADGTHAGSSSGLQVPLRLRTTPRIPAEQARRAATPRFKGKATGTGQPELFIDASSGRGRLAWETVVSGWAPDGQTPSRLHVISDALSGVYIGSFDEIHTVGGTGHGLHSGTVTVDTTLSGSTYQMIDPTHGGGRTCDMNNGTTTCTTFPDADNVWGDGTPANRQSAAVEAHYGAAKTFDYFKNVHGRNGIFGDGLGVPSRVHFGNNYANAFWDGAQMTYGGGAGNVDPLVALDVAGHEMGHGVTENVVPGGLIYMGESGGLNEATSDIFGNMVEFYAANPSDPGDYKVGEEITGEADPVRYMYDPRLDGASHSCWSLNTDLIDVHYSSGVGNHFFFNLAEGTGATPYGTSPVCGSAPAVVGIGRSKAERIWWRALDVYFTSDTRYVNTPNPGNTARAHTLSAATDLFGYCSTEYKAVQAAWTAVNVAGGDYCPTPNDFSVSVSPTSGAVNLGSSTTATLSTAVINGSSETVTFTTTGAPAGLTVSYSPASVPAGGSTTATFSAAASTEPGKYTVNLVGTSPSNTHSAAFVLTVNGPPGCQQTSNNDVPTRELSQVVAEITIWGCTGNAAATSSVSLDVVHTYIGDLDIVLRSPTGGWYTLHAGTGGSADDIKQTYTVNLAGEAANGTWRLEVRDWNPPDIGYINSWSLNLSGVSAPSCGRTNDTDVPVPDMSTGNGTIAVTGCAGNASGAATVAVNIQHPYIGDLNVALVAPDGSAYLLRERTGSNSDNLIRTFTVNLASEARNGTWTLRVRDLGQADVGYINSWTLTI